MAPANRDPAKRPLLLRGFRIDPARGGERIGRLPFLFHGPIEVTLRRPLTFLIGENGSGKTTLLEAIAARCAIRPGGGRSYAETEDDRAPTALSAAVEVTFGGRRPGVCPCPPPASGGWQRSRAAARACCRC